MINKFTQKAQDALENALTLAEGLGHSYIGTEHLLLSLVSQKDSIASRILSHRGADEKKLRKSIIDSIGIGNPSDICSEDMTPRLHFIIENAAKEADRNGIKYVGTEHLLIALLDRKDCVAMRLLEANSVSVSEIRSDLSAYLGSAPARSRETAKSEAPSKKDKKSVLLSHGKDLTAMAREGKTDPVLCRETETERLIRILCRRSKNNPCLIGEPGVGKTAVVEGLAERIVKGNVPSELASKKIITLDISSMIAGAKFRGEFEDRIKAVIEEVKRDPDIILFVDEMHIMVGAGAAEGAIDASNILKPSLSRGEIRMIGATTPAEYRSHIEKDSALERRFQPVKLEEPSAADTHRILSGLRSRYEAHHGIEISDGAIEAAVRLSVRYIHDRFLPDKAIDLIDEAAAKLKLSAPLSAHSSPYSVESQLSQALVSGDFEGAHLIAEEHRQNLRSSSVALLPTEAQKRPVLLSEHIAAVVSEQTDIPLQSLEGSEDGRLADLEDALKEEIIGQDDAIHSVVSAIQRGRSGISDPHRPIGSFLFLGSSGVGKTELCRVLAKKLFKQKDALIRLDMSEYMEKHSISKLIGSPPGYVGYGEGGLLTEKVRRRPYSVVLFDEIEKADPDIFHLLLQILDDGRLTDSSGRVTDFSSTVVIMTSNLISSSEALRPVLGFSENTDINISGDLRSHKKLREHFNPEFLGRVDELVLFSALDENDLCRISKLLLNRLVTNAKQSGILLSIDDDVALLAAKHCASLHKDMGARHLRRCIRELVETPLAASLLDTPSMRYSPITVGVKDGEIFFDN